MKFWKYIYELREQQEKEKNDNSQKQNEEQEQNSSENQNQREEETKKEENPSSEGYSSSKDTEESSQTNDDEESKDSNEDMSSETSSVSCKEQEETNDNETQTNNQQSVQENDKITKSTSGIDSQQSSETSPDNVPGSTENTENQDKNENDESLHSEEPIEKDETEEKQEQNPKESTENNNGLQNNNVHDEVKEEQIPESSEEQKDNDEDKNNQEKQSEESSLEDLEERKRKLEQLRDKLQQLADKKRKEESESSEKEKHHLHEEKKELEESPEKKYELSDQTNEFLNQLSELPSFKDRDRGPGYSIDTEGYTELPDSMIRTLITKFLNQRYCKHNTDLNVRSNSLKKSKGFYRWEVKDVIVHLETEQVTKVLDDKYGYEYANGRNENVPLSFYFDMSGSMSSYTNLLAVIAIELLKKNVKVLLGFNERVNVQIESINKNIDVAELASILESAGYSNYGWSGGRNSFIKDPRVTYKYIDQNLDNYLISKKAEKCVVFSDFDPLREVVNLSGKVDVYWFCFESSFDRSDLQYYNGFIYKVRNAKDLAEGLIKVNQKRFETLVYLDNPKSLQKKLGGK